MCVYIHEYENKVSEDTLSTSVFQVTNDYEFVSSPLLIKVYI